MALIASRAAAGKAVVGVWLGAQLLGDALGAPCLRGPEPEVGSFPVTLTEAGRGHPLFDGFEETFGSGHWHHDMPGLTSDATVPGTSEGCPADRGVRTSGSCTDSSAIWSSTGTCSRRSWTGRPSTARRPDRPTHVLHMATHDNVCPDRIDGVCHY
ncbi:hypothetical protein ACFY2M_42800 [Streptomyces sp. NPDC001276]|uniref:hypothetical protein n=1 Tax=Streptomyces sp. NPDC001276 TaxID=3364555 RepID=UPI0036A70615